MSRSCSVCEHPQISEINLAIASGHPLGSIAKRYELCKSSVRRHKVNGHAVQGLAESRARDESVEQAPTEKHVVGPDDLIGQVKVLQGVTLKILKDARDSGDARLALSAVDRALHNVEMLAKLQGELVERIQQDEKRLVIMKVVRASCEPVEKEQADGKANVDKCGFIDIKATEAD